jgi:hypothetical protein
MGRQEFTERGPVTVSGEDAVADRQVLGLVVPWIARRDEEQDDGIRDRDRADRTDEKTAVPDRPTLPYSGSSCQGVPRRSRGVPSASTGYGS